MQFLLLSCIFPPKWVDIYSFAVPLLVISMDKKDTVKAQNILNEVEHLLLLGIVSDRYEAIVWNIAGEPVRRQQGGTA